MALPQRTGVVGVIPHRRRASDRARERAGRAAYFGDRAGLLIATGSAVALMTPRAEADSVVDRRGQAPAAG
jgi:hypothetical protein